MNGGRCDRKRQKQSKGGGGEVGEPVARSASWVRTQKHFRERAGCRMSQEDTSLKTVSLGL